MTLTKSQKEVGKARDIIDAMGQRNEKKAAKWVKYFIGLHEKKELEKDQMREKKLSKLRKSKKLYYEMLRAMANDLIIKTERAGPGFIGGARLNSKGITAVLKTPWGKIYKRSFTPSGIPKYDLPAVMTLVGSLEDTMWHLEKTKITDSGVYLP